MHALERFAPQVLGEQSRRPVVGVPGQLRWIIGRRHTGPRNTQVNSFCIHAITQFRIRSLDLAGRSK